MNKKPEIIILIIMMTLLFFTVPAMAMDNGYARIVYNVRGLQDYDLHWNDRFPQGSIIKIYAEADGVNHRREVAVDYIFIIKDSNNNIVDTASYSSRYHDYRENDFITYSRDVLPDWEDGVYTAQIHIFDLLNDSVMVNYYDDVIEAYLNGSSKPDVPVMNRGDILNFTGPEKNRQLINITKTFYIDKYASKYPMDRFRVENILLDMKSVAPKMPVHVSATVVNTFYEKGTTSMSFLLDNKIIDSVTVEIEGSSSRQVAFEVSSEVMGNHSVEIVPTGNNTIGLNLSADFVVTIEKEVEVPAAFNFKDLQIDNLSVEPYKPVAITVTVENRGKEGSEPVELYINDVLEETKDVKLNFSEINDVKFYVTKADPGAYRVTIGKTNLSKIFFVGSGIATITETPIGIPEKEKKPQLGLVLGLSILVVLIYILRIYLKKRMK